jgi:hypothetical protein
VEFTYASTIRITESLHECLFIRIPWVLEAVSPSSLGRGQLRGPYIGKNFEDQEVGIRSDAGEAERMDTIR